MGREIDSPSQSAGSNEDLISQFQDRQSDRVPGDRSVQKLECGLNSRLIYKLLAMVASQECWTGLGTTEESPY